MTGVATFGGDGYGSLDANALPDAARVLYIAPTFPSGEPNLSGWADWSGTSFATGIISGLSAHLMARSMPALNVINRLAAGQQTRSDQLFWCYPCCSCLTREYSGGCSSVLTNRLPYLDASFFTAYNYAQMER